MYVFPIPLYCLEYRPAIRPSNRKVSAKPRWQARLRPRDIAPRRLEGSKNESPFPPMSRSFDVSSFQLLLRGSLALSVSPSPRLMAVYVLCLHGYIGCRVGAEFLWMETDITSPITYPPPPHPPLIPLLSILSNGLCDFRSSFSSSRFKIFFKIYFSFSFLTRLAG